MYFTLGPQNDFEVAPVLDTCAHMQANGQGKHGERVSVSMTL